MRLLNSSGKNTKLQLANKNVVGHIFLIALLEILYGKIYRCTILEKWFFFLHKFQLFYNVLSCNLEFSRKDFPNFIHMWFFVFSLLHCEYKTCIKSTTWLFDAHTHTQNNTYLKRRRVAKMNTIIENFFIHISKLCIFQRTKIDVCYE